jgi:hypothetical protein
MTDPKIINDGLLLCSLKDFKDEHMQETLKRAHAYVASRIAAGNIVDEASVYAAFAAFGDGFCTGFHRGNGTICTRG